MASRRSCCSFRPSLSARKRSRPRSGLNILAERKPLAPAGGSSSWLRLSPVPPSHVGDGGEEDAHQFGGQSGKRFGARPQAGTLNELVASLRTGREHGSNALVLEIVEPGGGQRQ